VTPGPRAVVVGLIVVCAAGGGCASRFTAKNEYLAAGFTRESLRGRTVAVLPAPESDAAATGELAGIALGMREAGARARLVAPPDAPGPAAATRPVAGASNKVAAPAHTPRADARAFRDMLRRLDRGDAAYLLLVDVTDADVYRAFAARPAAASRTSGRRVGLRLALLRLSDGAAVWIAEGTGEMWETWTDARGDAAAPATVDDDLRVGNAGLYPPAPDARVVSRRLTRRLLALVPTPAELQPN
jgi:hypothetical protein